jgi:tetratricopeptide (TPR) repeat protein
MSRLDPEAIRKQVEFDRLTTAANVYRVKGDYARAAEAIAGAIDLFPDNLDSREFAADILAATGEIEKAAEHYRSLYSKQYPRISAEEKYAKLIVQIAENKRQQQQLLDQLENPAKFRPLGQNPYIAAAISIAPGFGHIYGGQFKKGAALFIGAFTCWMLFYLLCPKGPMKSADFFQNLSIPAIVCALAAAFIQIYAFIDAAVSVDKLRRKQNPC